MGVLFNRSNPRLHPPTRPSPPHPVGLNTMLTSLAYRHTEGGVAIRPVNSDATKITAASS